MRHPHPLHPEMHRTSGAAKSYLTEMSTVLRPGVPDLTGHGSVVIALCGGVGVGVGVGGCARRCVRMWGGCAQDVHVETRVNVRGLTH